MTTNRGGATSRLVVIAIDDTDMPDTRGTGRLARMLTQELEEAGLGRSVGVTRHQFWDGPGVPFTSHNSANAIGLDSAASLDDLEAFARRVMEREFIEGSDPGLALLTGPAPAEVIAFARRAQRELVRRQEAEALIDACGLRVRGLAGTRDGMIGALCASALRWEGNDGRYIGLPGIRDLVGRVRVASVFATAPVAAVIDEGTGSNLDAAVMLDTGDWVRPRLMDGRPVVVARPSDEAGVWINADRRTHED